MDDRDIEFLMDAKAEPEAITMHAEFTEDELHSLLTAVADQRTYYKQAANNCTEHNAENRNVRRYYLDKQADNARLYGKLQSMLLALETAEGL